MFTRLLMHIQKCIAFTVNHLRLLQENKGCRYAASRERVASRPLELSDHISHKYLKLI